MQLRFFYDGSCPLCTKEILHLQKLDTENRIDFQNIHAEDFASKFPNIDAAKADSVLHGELADGKIITGLDVTCKAWQLVGRGYYVAFLRWPIVRILADLVYRWFAKNRSSISYLLTGQAHCQNQCKPPGKTG